MNVRAPGPLKRPIGPMQLSAAQGWNALVLAAVILGGLMLALQLWLLTIALDLFLAGNGGDVWQLAVASAVLFAGGLLALTQTGGHGRARGTGEPRR